MSYQRGTTHYNLPQTIGTDKRDWSDTNQAFSDVDAALYAASENASGAASVVTALDTRLTTQEGKMTTAEGDIAALQASDTTQDTAILNLQNTVGDLTNTKIAEVVADGVKTISQILNELYIAASPHLTVGTRYDFRFQAWTIPADLYVNDMHLAASHTSIVNAEVQIVSYYIAASSSQQMQANINTSGTTVADTSSNVPPQGYKYELHVLY